MPEFLSVYCPFYDEADYLAALRLLFQVSLQKNLTQESFMPYHVGMSSEEAAILKHISDTLDKLFVFITRPPNRGVQAFNTIVAIVGILGIIAIVDVLLSWVRGN